MTALIFKLKLKEEIILDINKGTRYIDVMSWMTRVALESITQGGLGHTFHSFDGDGKSAVYENAIKLLL